jgi:hypothetical protein
LSLPSLRKEGLKGLKIRLLFLSRYGKTRLFFVPLFVADFFSDDEREFL